MKRFGALLVLFAALSASARAATIVAMDAWSRPAIDTGVVYVRVRNAGAPDRLIGARSPVARAVELHRSMEMSGMSSMEPVRALPLPANGTLARAPGGAHIMLIGLRHDLHAGQTFPVELHFARTGWIAATVRVRPI